MRRRAKDFDLNKSFVRNQTADSCQKKGKQSTKSERRAKLKTKF